MYANARSSLLAFGLLVFAVSLRAADPPKGQRVFTAGHSFHMMIPGPLAELAKAADINGHEMAGTQGIGGSRTIQHWDLADDKNKAKQAIKSGKVDVLTLSPHLQLPDPGIDHFVKLCLEHNPDSRVLVQASWMPFDDPKNMKGKFANGDRNKSRVDELRKAYEPFDKALHDQVAGINKQFQDRFKRQVVFLVPVGHAVMDLRERILAGKVPGIANQADLFTDPIGHGKPPIGILNAYCHFAVIYKQSPVGLPVASMLKKTEKADELNKLLQEIAWAAVTKEPLSGVK